MTLPYIPYTQVSLHSPTITVLNKTLSLAGWRQYIAPDCKSLSFIGWRQTREHNTIRSKSLSSGWRQPLHYINTIDLVAQYFSLRHYPLHPVREIRKKSIHIFGTTGKVSTYEVYKLTSIKDSAVRLKDKTIGFEDSVNQAQQDKLSIEKLVEQLREQTVIVIEDSNS